MNPSDFNSIKPGSVILGLDAAGPAEIVQVLDFGPDAKNITFRQVTGRVGERLLYSGEEATLELAKKGRAYAFDADGGLLRLASEAYRIRLAHLFDPYLAVSASQITGSEHRDARHGTHRTRSQRTALSSPANAKHIAVE